MSLQQFIALHNEFSQFSDTQNREGNVGYHGKKAGFCTDAEKGSIGTLRGFTKLAPSLNLEGGSQYAGQLFSTSGYACKLRLSIHSHHRVRQLPC